MGLPKMLYLAMLGVGWQAKRHKIPSSVACSTIDIAQMSLDLCQKDARATIQFARLVLSGPSNLRCVTAKLPGPVAEACFRLINLLEYLADLEAKGL